MKVLLKTTRTPRLVKASCLLVLIFLLAACTGRGGGWLPPNSTQGFTAQATLGFSFSCQDSSPLVGPTGTLKIELDYSDKGTNPLGGAFSIHGKADTLPLELESMYCFGQNPSPPPLEENELIFLGVYRPTSSPPPGPLVECTRTDSGTAEAQCRFEVHVIDNDHNSAPSAGDYFSIKLSTSTVLNDELTEGIIYTRDGFLGGGNITVN